MTIVIDEPARPETLIRFSVDIGNGTVGADTNYVRVSLNGITDLYRWEIGVDGNLDVEDENGTASVLKVNAGGVIVIDLDNPPPAGTESYLYIVDVSTQNVVATPSSPIQPVPQPGPPAQEEGGLVFV
jgi:hypothetical protein